MKDFENCSEAVLIRRARRGDIQAFGVLYGRIYKELYRFALYTMRHKQDAEDVVSETVVAAYEGIDRLKKEESFRSWIFTILANQCKKRFLRKGETEELSDELIAEEPDHASDHDVREALMLLGEDDRLIVAWSVLGGYSSEEIGKILEMNPATVRSRKSRALEQMHRILEN